MTFFTQLWRALACYRRERRTTAELARLSERDLEDIGITRSEIGAVAHEAAGRGGLDLYSWSIVRQGAVDHRGRLDGAVTSEPAWVVARAMLGAR